MPEYYYLAASLPALVLGETPPLSSARFDDLCREHLAADDREAVEALRDPARGPCPHPFVAAWREADTRLRNAVARARATRRRRDPAAYLREQAGVDLFVEKAVADALARPDPLDREMALDRLRWRLADELAGYSPFSSRAVLAYAVKLNLAERWAGLSEDRAQARADAIVSRGPSQGVAA
jgi:hypothetical protein